MNPKKLQNRKKRRPDDAIKKALGKYAGGNKYDDPREVTKLVEKYEKGQLSDSEISVFSNLRNQFNFEGGLSFLAAIPESHEGMMMRLRKKTIEEYNCKTHLEYALADIIAMSYIRILEQGYLLNIIASDGAISKHQAEVMKIASKEADRANRNFLSAIQTLLQMKSKPINVQIKNAYMAQNQQVNQKD